MLWSAKSSTQMDGRELRIGMDFGDWPLKVAQRVTDRLPQ